MLNWISTLLQKMRSNTANFLAIDENKLCIKQLILYIMIIIIHVTAVAIYFFDKRGMYSTLQSKIGGIIVTLSTLICFSLCSRYLFGRWWFADFVSHSNRQEDKESK